MRSPFGSANEGDKVTNIPVVIGVLDVVKQK